MHISGADAVDPDAVRGHFACKGLREPNKGGLRRGVGDLTGIGHHVARDRAGDDDGPGVVAHHGGQGRAADVPDTLDVDADMCIAPRVVAGKEVAERADAGVAVENVDCSVCLEGEADMVLAGLGIAHVAAKADRFPASCLQLLGELQDVVASGGEHHARPLFGENAGDTCPNALGSSCDNGNLPIKLTYADQLPLMQAMRRAIAPAPPYKMPTMVGRPCCRDADGGFRAHYRTVASGVQVIYKPFREKHAMVQTVCSKVDRAYMEDRQ